MTCVRSAGLLLLTLVAGCDLAASFRCDSDAQCVTGGSGAGGACELATHACTEADASCATGRRYSRAAPSAIASQCTGGVDLGGDGPAPLCADTPGALACDDFEGGLRSAWVPQVSSGTIGVDDKRARSGSRALHVHVPASTVLAETLGAFVVDQTSFGAVPTTGDVYLRAFYYVDAPAIPSDTSLLLFQQVDAPYDYLSVQAPSAFMALATNLGGDGGRVSASVKLPLRRWACVEVRMTMTKTGPVRLSLDGVEVPDVALAADLQPSQPLRLLKLGYYVASGHDGPTSNTDVYIDDFRVDASPIGCAR